VNKVTTWKDPREAPSAWVALGSTLALAWTRPSMAGGCPKHESWVNNPQLRLLPSRKSSVEVRLYTGSRLPIGFVVLRCRSALAGQWLSPTLSNSDIVFKTKWKVTNSCCATFTLDPAEGNVTNSHGFVLVPCTFEPDCEASFTVQIGASAPMAVEGLAAQLLSTAPPEVHADLGLTAIQACTVPRSTEEAEEDEIDPYIVFILLDVEGAVPARTQTLSNEPRPDWGEELVHLSIPPGTPLPLRLGVTLHDADLPGGEDVIGWGEARLTTLEPGEVATLRLRCRGGDSTVSFRYAPVGVDEC